MKNIFSYLLSKKYYVIVVSAVILTVFLVSGRGNGKEESYTAILTNIEQSITLSGEVRTSDRADLGFASSGRIAKVNVENNESVRKGQVLAQLEIGELMADLTIKKINATTSSIDLEGAREDLERVRKLEDTKVANAYKTLLSDGLIVTPDSLNYTATAPTVSGAYTGEEGIYKINIEKKNATSNDYELRTFNLEKTVVEVDKESATPLGTKGIYISFSSDLEEYHDTIWYLEIPNKKSSLYLTNLNSWNEAKENRDRAVKQAELEYEKLLNENEGSEFAIAQAEIDKINAEIQKSTIYAPFSGKVTNIDKKVGENVSVGERVVSIIGEDKLEVVLQVSELDVAKIYPELPVSIHFDAFPDEVFLGTLSSINSKDTNINGVPVYEAFVELNASQNIRTGMNLEAKVILNEKKNVVGIPSRFIKEESKSNFVEVKDSKGRKEKREVVLGLKGTNSMVEVISGLNVNEKIILDMKEE
ncbi:MAG: efflux RND transporter periplasmic adaptor subunit [Candidatus Paceibacterota bacterium]|jgi:HlyD family secretion protein